MVRDQGVAEASPRLSFILSLPAQGFRCRERRFPISAAMATPGRGQRGKKAKIHRIINHLQMAVCASSSVYSD
jgi:hypothetical protein